MASETAWTLARNSHFEVYSHAGSAEARQVLLRFERLRLFFGQQTGVNVDRRLPLRILVFSSREEYAPFRLKPSADAYYAAGGDRDYIVLPAPDTDRLGAHEYWHFVAHTGSLGLPLWLNEGLAEFYSTVRLDSRGARMGAAPPLHTGFLRSRPWISLPVLLSLPANSPLLRERETSEMFYVECWALAHMLMLSPDYAPRFPQLMERLRGAMPSVEALENTYGRPIRSIANDLRIWFGKGRTMPLPAGAPPADAAVEVMTVSPSLVHSLFAEILNATERPQQAEMLYRELTGESPEDPDIPAALALLALGRDDPDEARRQWRQAVGREIRNANTCYRFAMLAEDAGISANEVRAALELAVHLDPHFDDALFSLALAENRAGEPEAALWHLRGMTAVSPGRRFVYWIAMADALNELGRRQEAKAAAENARTWAANAEERAHAESLVYQAETDLAVRFRRDAEGNLSLETARAPHNAPDWNPFIEAGDRVRQVEGNLREIGCGTAGTVFLLETPSAMLELRVPDPTHVQMRNAPPEFTCGPQDGAVVHAVYAETGSAAGLLRGLEFWPNSQLAADGSH